MFDRFTERARKVLLLAREEAKNFNHDYIGTEHILLGLIKEGQGVASAVLQNLGLSLERIRLEIEKKVATGPDIEVLGEIEFTPRAKRVIELAMEEARKFGHNYIGTEHLLLGLLLEEEGVAASVLNNLGVSLSKIQKEIMQLLGASFPASEVGAVPKRSKTPALDSFGRDLTVLAREGKLDPVIGRKDEIERVLQVLGRRTKNNPVLLGEAGVGKTAIIEGLAQKVIEGNVPEILRDKRIMVLDIALMVAGTKYRGQFEERIKSVMDEIRKSEDIILFIDEIHTLVGAGGAEGAIDASNILKPALSRGEIQVIGATTLDEYRKYIEKDGALERRFQTIIVEAPNTEETIQILRGLRDKYEAHHRAKITDDALVAAAQMSERYISGRFLPDKAIDVLDEAGSKVRLSVTTLPPDFYNLEKSLQRVTEEKEEAIKNQDFEAAASLRDQERKVKKDIEEFHKGWKSSKTELETVVTVDDIAEVISKVTGVPVTRITEKESKRLIHMEKELDKEVIGQQEAIRVISQAIRRSRSGMKDPKRPIGSFVFLGPTGVGKTLLAKRLAHFMFGDEAAMIELDMSEYMEKFSVSRLIGAPPGYVGFEEGGQLAERVRRHPYSVILLDEIEKAHPDVFNLLLQILEEGRLTDSFGRKIDFRNTILIMTSNIGVETLMKQSTLGFQAAKEEKMDYETVKTKLLDEVKKVFRPEFLNRLDDIIVFNPLGKKELERVIDIEIKYVKNRLKQQGLELSLTPKAKKFLIDKGFDAIYGARPLKRAIQRHLEDRLSEEILKGDFKKRCNIKSNGEEECSCFFGGMMKWISRITLIFLVLVAGLSLAKDRLIRHSLRQYFDHKGIVATVGPVSLFSWTTIRLKYLRLEKPMKQDKYFALGFHRVEFNLRHFLKKGTMKVIDFVDPYVEIKSWLANVLLLPSDSTRYDLKGASGTIVFNSSPDKAVRWDIWQNGNLLMKGNLGSKDNDQKKVQGTIDIQHEYIKTSLTLSIMTDALSIQGNMLAFHDRVMSIP